MKPRIIFGLLFACYFHACFCEEGFFKVPHDGQQRPERDEDRPPRLVETSSDPDLKRLKALEDKFFKVAQNTSLTKEFKSFQDLLHLIDSEAGKELGRLFFNGILVGMGKEQSNQLLLEFWEEFQYRISPDLAGAFNDYYDFIKGMDLALLPMTMQMLFQKDNLGNSLAQMPLGQLVDLIQPEASRYGIDIRGFINGILGKDSSKFPELVQKYLINFNITNLISSITTSVMDDNEIATEVSNKINEDEPNKEKLVKSTTKILNLFKPFISKILKDNKVALDPDAIIQVITPFVSGGGELMNKFLQGNFGSKDGGKGFDFSKLLPLLGMLGSGQGKSKPGSSNQDGGLDLSQVLPLLGGMLGSGQGDGKQKDGAGFDVAQLLPLLGMIGGANQQRGSKKDGGFDMTQLLPLLGLLGGKDKSSGGGGESLDKTLSMVSSLLGGGDTDLSSIMNVASQFLANSNQRKQDKKDKKEIPNMKETSEKLQEVFANIEETQRLMNADSLKEIEEFPQIMKNLNEKLQDLKQVTNMFKKLDPNKHKLEQEIPQKQKDVKKMDVKYEETEENEEPSEANVESSPNIEIQTEFPDFSGSLLFREALRDLIIKGKDNTDSHSNFKITLKKGKDILKKMIESVFDPQWFNAMVPLLQQSMPQYANVEVVQKLFTFSHNDWDQFFSQLEHKQVRAPILEAALEPATSIAGIINALTMNNLKENTRITKYFDDLFNWLDLTDVTLRNFPITLNSLAVVLTKGYHIPVDLTLVLEPSQGFVMEHIQWYTSRIEENKKLSNQEFKAQVLKSLDEDFVESALLLKKLLVLSNAPNACIPKAVCSVMKKVDREYDSHLKKVFVTFGSLVIGMLKEDNDSVRNLDILLASLGSEDCETAFVKSCEERKYSKPKTSQKKPDKKEKKTEKKKPKAEKKEEGHDHSEL